MRRPYSGSVLTLGVQALSFDVDRLRDTAKQAGFSSQPLTTFAKLPGDLEVTDAQLFEVLGFSELVRSDASSYEGANIIFDLNNGDGPPAPHAGRFDCVIDGGTMEHVFHVPNALKNIFEFAKVGGRIVHMSPTSNYADHGFYSFSPTLFYDYYSENGFAIDRCQFIRQSVRAEHGPWIAGEYFPGALDEVANGGLDDRLYATFFVATKTTASTAHRIPQQSLYRQRWAKKDDLPPETFGQKVVRRARRLEKRLRRKLGMVRFPIKPNTSY